MHDISSFTKIVWDYYEEHGRHTLPWRLPHPDGAFDPYTIMVSEIMLQQTQVGRVIPKYEQFLQQFPNVQLLADAPLADVLKLWSGLGYNRRAKFLWQAAGKVSTDFHGEFPQTVPELTTLPGIGKNTAGTIAAYAFDRPVVFVETNVRTVLIHHFFKDQDGIPDKTLQALLEDIMDIVDRQNQDGRSPRTWYWALMDYGTYLKQTVGNLNRHSKTYVKQSTFEGSKRQVRGRVLKLLAEQSYTEPQLAAVIDDVRLPEVLADLLREEIISTGQDGHYHLGSA